MIHRRQIHVGCHIYCLYAYFPRFIENSPSLFMVLYVDLKAAFDSLDRDALWKAIQGIDTPLKILNLLRGLHCETSSRVREGHKLCSSFVTTTVTGVRQGCVLAPKLFCTAIDWTMNNIPPEL